MKIFDKKRITDKIEYKDFLCYDYLILNIDLAPVLCYNKPHGVNKNLACKPFTPERTLKHKSGLRPGGFAACKAPPWIYVIINAESLTA